jgi:Dolichyl-phosphate-mannose-protein mannosyltransferase
VRPNTIRFASAGTPFLIVFLAQGVFFIGANSPTYDEAMHLAAGYSYLAKRDFRLEPQNPPLIKEFLALPLFLQRSFPFNPDAQHWRNGDGYSIGQDLLYRSTLPADRILFLSRIPNLFLGGILIALIGWWAYRVWGIHAGILAMALAALEPNLIVHSSLITTDLGATLLIFLTVYILWEYLNAPKWWLLAATGISTGMTLASKFSAILLIPMIVSIIGLSFVLESEARFLPHLQRYGRPRQKFLEVFILFLLTLFFASLVIPLAYLFQGIQPWLLGLRQFLALAEEGQLAFFLGEYSYQGWWSYFMIAFLIKTPVGTLILIASSLIFWRAGSALGRREAIFLLTPVVLVFVALSQARVNIGLRHILPVYPFLLVLASRLATVRFRRGWLAQFLIGVAVLSTAISSFRIAPHQLAYFNEFVGGPEQGYRYLSDSNLDWGQDLKGVKAYMDKENLPIIYLSYFGTAPPAYYGIRYQYVPGAWPLEWPPPTDKVPETAPRKILAVSVYNLQDVSNPYNPLFRWLWTRLPLAKIGYSIFVYDLADDREGLVKLEETYVKSGIRPAPVISN